MKFVEKRPKRPTYIGRNDLPQIVGRNDLGRNDLGRNDSGAKRPQGRKGTGPKRPGFLTGWI